MVNDALDPGPHGDYPWLPRTPDGYLDTTRMPIGLRKQNGVLIDVEPSVADGRRVTQILPPPPEQ